MKLTKIGIMVYIIGLVGMLVYKKPLLDFLIFATVLLIGAGFILLDDILDKNTSKNRAKRC